MHSLMVAKRGAIIKYLCDYIMPECVTELSNFSLSLECFDHFSPELKLQMYELFTITINSQGARK